MTPTDTEGDGGTPTDEPQQTQPPDDQRMTDTVRIFTTNTADEFNFLPFTPSDNTGGDLMISQLDATTNVEDATDWRGTDTWEVPNHVSRDEIEVVTWLTDWSVEAPYDHYNSHDDRCTFWNGEPFDAEARELFDHVDYYSAGNKYEEGTVFRREATSQWEFHWWRSRGEVPGADDDPANEIVLGNGARRTDGNWPLPPEWSEPWIQTFDSVGTEERYQEEINNLYSDRVDFERMAENGWGSGPYEIQSPDDVGSDSVLMTLRSEDNDATEPHPHAEHANIDFIEMQLGALERENTLASQGEIDIHEGAVTPNGSYTPDMLPDHIQETTRYFQLTGGDSLWWNMNNPHLENLWVRRAMVTAIDWVQAGVNGWGEQRSIPLEQDTGCLDVVANSTFSQEFLDQLHTWPKEADVETATTYMQNAGYERQGGTWVSPDGNEPQIDVQIRGDIGDWVGAGQTIRDSMRSFGIPMTFSQPDASTWNSNLDTFRNEPNFDTSIHWYGRPNAFGHYKSQAAPWDNGSIVGGDGGVAPGSGSDRRSADPDDEYTIVNQPLHVELPTEVGSIDAPTGADAAPNNPADLSGNGIDSVEMNVIETMNALREPADSQEAAQERLRLCARYYNYYIPKFAFHQYTFGEWGNVRDFDWPPADHNSMRYQRSFNITDTLTQGGILQASYDEELDR